MPPNHEYISMQIARLAAVIEPIPHRLDKMEEKWDEDIDELRKEIASLKQARSHFIGIGVGISVTFTFLAGLIATLATNLFGWFPKAG